MLKQTEHTNRLSLGTLCAPVAQRLEQQTHNLLVRGSNPCGGTNQLARVLTFTSSCCWADSCSTSRWREDGAIWELRDPRVMRSVPSAVADGFDDPDTLLRLNLTTLAGSDQGIMRRYRMPVRSLASRQSAHGDYHDSGSRDRAVSVRIAMK